MSMHKTGPYSVKIPSEFVGIPGAVDILDKDLNIVAISPKNNSNLFASAPYMLHVLQDLAWLKSGDAIDDVQVNMIQSAIDFANGVGVFIHKNIGD